MDAKSQQVYDVQKLFVTHSSVIKGFIASLLPDFSLVDDVLHEVFLVVTQRADDYEPGSSFLAWATAIARRKVLEACRDRRHRPAEIAQRIGWTAESVYVALSRARAALRECVGRKLAAAGVE